jgi:nitrous oxidase accessory protein NosD
MEGRICAAVVGAAALVLAALPVRGAVAAEREISGNRTFSGEVVIPKGDVWRVAPGAAIRFRGGKLTVRGMLVVGGTAERPVRIAGDNAFEGLDIRGADGSVVENAVISGGSRGAQVTNGSAAFRRVRFEKNGIGLDVGQYAKAAVSDCVFDAPERAGVLVRRGGAAAIAGSRFEGASKAGIYVFGAGDVSATGCRFEKNVVGVQAAMPGAHPAIARCAFRENGTGLLVEKMADPAVSECEFAGNRTGLRFTRRAEGRVSKSRIEGNGDGVLVEFSSYPVFRENVFRGNRDAAVRLRHQSSEWEEELGDAERAKAAVPGGAPFGARPGGRADFRPEGGSSPAGGAPDRPGARKAPLEGTVDFRGNDWGAPVREDATYGTVEGIHDGRDEPTFEYEGKRYRMDRVLLK